MSKKLVFHYIFCLAGICVAIYSLHVESKLYDPVLPDYAPSCDLSAWKMSCSKVFKSPYAHILSHWNIVAKSGRFDFSLPQLAFTYFVLMFFQPSLVLRNVFYAHFFKWLSFISIGFNLYLAYILKFVLGEFCLVCVSNYFINVGLVLTVNYINADVFAASNLRSLAKKTT